MPRPNWKSWELPEPPESNSPTGDKKSWVMDCDVALGVEHLGGILGAASLANPETFERVLTTVRQTIQEDAANSRASHDRRQELLIRNISRGHPHESLCEYLYSFSAAAWPLMMADRDFAKWAVDANGKWEQPTSMLLGGCLNLVAIWVYPDMAQSPEVVKRNPQVGNSKRPVQETHELISLTKWPSMPQPFSSDEPGEAWVWGDYVAILQVRPKVVAEMIGKITGKSLQGPVPITYPFAMTVFYRKDRNPHGPSSRPILVATLEKADYAAAAKLTGANIDVGSLGLGGSAPLVQGLFTAETRFNLGDYQGQLTQDDAREYFLDLVGRHFALDTEPVKIGPISAVFGHPNTGWPAQEPRKRKGGCLGVLVLLVLVLAAVWSVFRGYTGKANNAMHSDGNSAALHSRR